MISGAALLHININLSTCLKTNSSLDSSAIFRIYLNILMAYTSYYYWIRVIDFDKGLFFTTKISSSSFDIPKKLVLFLKTFLKKVFESNWMILFNSSEGVSSIWNIPSSLGGERKSYCLSFSSGLYLSERISLNFGNPTAYSGLKKPTLKVPGNAVSEWFYIKIDFSLRKLWCISKFFFS